MSLRKANITWNSKQVSKMIDNGKITFDNVVQRGDVWETERRSYLIDSIITGFPVPPIYAKRGEEKVYDILEGQQRLLTMNKLFHEEFAFKGLNDIVLTDEVTGEVKTYQLNGLRFSELPEEIKEIITTFNFTIYYFDDITPEEVREMFKRLNNGKPLSTKERNIANCKDIENMIEIGQHEIFHDMMNKKSYHAKKYVPIIVKIYLMIYKSIEDISFEGKYFNPVIERIRITDDGKKKLEDVFDLIGYVHDSLASDTDKRCVKIAKKVYKETHLISLVPFVVRALEENLNADIFTDWVMKFFDSEEGASISLDYNEACLAGSAKSENIQKRHKALEENFNEYYSKIENYKKED